ncbi:MAG: site-specific integrase [Elusimicrobia bacterium]|nr:site-specific integrase [Elusimicrobiota bacterium]
MGGRKPTLASYLPGFLDYQYSDRPKARLTAERIIKRFIAVSGNRPLAAVSRAVVSDYVRRRLRDTRRSPFRGRWASHERAAAWQPAEARKVSKSTINREVTYLLAMLNRAVADELIAANPVVRWKKFNERPYRRRRYLRDHEITALLAACEDCGNPLLQDIVRLALYTGRRKHDMLAIQKRDYDRANGIVTLPETKKGEVEQIVLPASAQAVLNARFDGAPGEWLFPNKAGTGPLTDFDTSFKTVKKRAGLTDLHFHDLRHTAISGMVMEGLDFFAIATLVGHSTPTMIEERYGHLSPEHIKNACEKFGRRMDRIISGAPRCPP